MNTSTVKGKVQRLKSNRRFRQFLKHYGSGVNAYAAAIRAGYSEAIARGRSYELARVAQRLLGWDEIPPSGRGFVRQSRGPMWRRMRKK